MEGNYSSMTASLKQFEQVFLKPKKLNGLPVVMVPNEILGPPLTKVQAGKQRDVRKKAEAAEAACLTAMMDRIVNV